jgi:RNA polymerase sigma-70 factor (ECF subfamily)
MKSIETSYSDFLNKILNEKSNLKNFALSLTRNTDEANDLLQDTYYKAIKYREKFLDSTNIKAWLFTIMKNTFINNYRRTVKSRDIFEPAEDLTLLKAFKKSGIDQSENLIFAKEIVKEIENLDEHYRKPFVMYYNGFKYEEISKMMNLPLGTVKSRIFLARKILMQKLQASYPNLQKN